jgi:hypothetical protein
MLISWYKKNTDPQGKRHMSERGRKENVIQHRNKCIQNERQTQILGKEKETSGKLNII